MTRPVKSHGNQTGKKVEGQRGMIAVGPRRRRTSRDWRGYDRVGAKARAAATFSPSAGRLLFGDAVISRVRGRSCLTSCKGRYASLGGSSSPLDKPQFLRSRPPKGTPESQKACAAPGRTIYVNSP